MLDIHKKLCNQQRMDTNIASNIKVSIDIVESFILKNNEDNERQLSLEERTDSAILLLQSLPCARFAVLDKIGEIFFDDAKQFVLEIERQHLSGYPIVYDHVPTKRDDQIRKIHHVLVRSVESNTKAWGPMIFQWSIQILSQICSQYATKRNFISLSIEERFQMWLNCSATNILLETMMCCLERIIIKNEDNCMRLIINTTLSNAPYFDWALAHISFTFTTIVPFKLLYFALEAFSNQSRKAELIIETMLTVFRLIYRQKPQVILDVIFQLYLESVTSLRPDDHVSLCTLPFLLHLCTLAKEFFVSSVEKFINSLNTPILEKLELQSTVREDVLQRGIFRRLVECLKMINESTFKLLMLLLKYAFQEDIHLNKEYPGLAKSAADICSLSLELLQLQLQSDVLVYSHYVSTRLKKKSGKETSKVPFLTSLAHHTKQLTLLMLKASGKKKAALLHFLCLMAVQEGVEKKIEVLTVILVNSNFKSTGRVFKQCVARFDVDSENIVQVTLKEVFSNLVVSNSKYSLSQINNFFKYLTNLVNEERNNATDKLDVLNHLKEQVSKISQVLLSTVDSEVAMVVIELLQNVCSTNLRISSYSIVIQSTINYYMTCLERVRMMENRIEFQKTFSEIQKCDELLVVVVNENKNIQQSVLRMLVEGMSMSKNLAEEELSAEFAEPLVKYELLDKNYCLLNGNRFQNNLTSVSFKDGLRLNKRRADETDEQNEQLVHNIFINTLTNLLSISSSLLCPKSREHNDSANNFSTTWGEKQYTRTFPSAYAYIATVLVELVCPEITPVTSWPDEDFLKYTIERDLKVKNTFDKHPIFWDIAEIISSARPSLYHCSVLMQSLLGMAMKFWQTNRNKSTIQSPVQLKDVSRIMLILNQSGWLPVEFNSIADIFHLIKPREVYEILSAIWKYLKMTSFAPDKFIDRDSLGRPQLPINTDEQISNQIRKIEDDPTIRRMSSLQAYLRKLLKKNEITQQQYDEMRPRNARPARAHGLPKIHKNFTNLLKVSSDNRYNRNDTCSSWLTSSNIDIIEILNNLQEIHVMGCGTSKSVRVASTNGVPHENGKIRGDRLSLYDARSRRESEVTERRRRLSQMQVDEVNKARSRKGSTVSSRQDERGDSSRSSVRTPVKSKTNGKINSNGSLRSDANRLSSIPKCEIKIEQVSDTELEKSVERKQKISDIAEHPSEKSPTKSDNGCSFQSKIKFKETSNPRQNEKTKESKNDRRYSVLSLDLKNNANNIVNDVLSKAIFKLKSENHTPTDVEKYNTNVNYPSKFPLPADRTLSIDDHAVDIVNNMFSKAIIQAKAEQNNDLF